ncbi:MAG: hypothetical protein IIT53_05280 [Fibrobacter sp.]|nr:hypothetical protein [Fibrobacter sp.]
MLRNFRTSFLCVCICSLFLTLGVTESFAAKKISSSEVSRRQLLMKMKNKDDDMRAFCSGMDQCLGIRYEACTDAELKPWPKVDYSEEYCKPYKDIVNRGFSLDIRTHMMTDIFLRLGRQYRVVYESEGTLPLEVNEITFLFDNMPFTADLINAYLESEYTLSYNSTNRRYFSGNNGHGLSGDFYWALQDSAGTKSMLRNMFFGYGYAQILRWSLKGTAVAFLDMNLVAPRTIKYKLTAYVFPSNSVLNSIMHMRVFKSVVNSKIDDVVNDIKKAATMYYGGDRRPLANNAKLRTPENQRHIAEFDNVVAGGPWKLGDAERLERNGRELSKPKLVAKPAEPTEPVEPKIKANIYIKKDSENE